METNYKQFKKGQKVINRYGKTLTVLFQRDCHVFVVGEVNSWYHPSNLFVK